MKNIFYGLLLSVLLAACSSTNIVTLTVTQPPVVGIASDIQKVGIVSRTKSNTVLDKLDRVLSLESQTLEKQGEQELVTGFKAELMNARRFDEMLELKNIHLTSTGIGVMSKPLSWGEVGDICTKNNVDILFVLEAYDTDTYVDVNKERVVMVNRRGEERTAVRTDAHVNASVRSSWRVYDPLTSSIMDEYSFTQNQTVARGGANPFTAIAGVVNRNSTVLDLSYGAGATYAHRFLPHDIRVSRVYYVKGTDNFKTAKRLAQTGKWTEAAEYWKKETANEDPKIAGRAYYNMAILSEINGHLELAIDWASKAYAKFENKQALRYVNVLKNRQLEEQKLKDLNLK